MLLSGGITSLAWEPASIYFASAGGLDRYIRLWNNVAGQKILLDELKDKLPKATSEALKVILFSIVITILKCVKRHPLEENATAD